MSGLQGQTTLTGPERRAEMKRIVVSLLDHIDEMDTWEQGFLASMNDNLDLSLEWVPTPKQLFKARDINCKY